MGMPHKNSNLGRARKEKNDEFYTRLSDIENELKYYKNHFRNKVVLCNCDDPFESNFFKYFCMNFNNLGLKKLIATSYDGSPFLGDELKLFYDEENKPTKIPYKAVITSIEDFNNDGAVDLEDTIHALKFNDGVVIRLNGNGDFRSPECLELLDEADIVCTNPPFSLFREYINLLVKKDKQFLILGNQNNITYKEVFPLIKENRVWLGVNNGSMSFRVPETATGSTVYIDEKTGNKYQKFGNIAWFSNLDHNKRHEWLYPANGMEYEGNESKYPKYVNYAAIEVSKVADIPKDYYGLMGVPITFLDKYNPEQFEIIGISLEIATPISEVAAQGMKYTKGGNRFYIQDSPKTYKRMYDRIVIKRK